MVNFKLLWVHLFQHTRIVLIFPTPWPVFHKCVNKTQIPQENVNRFYLCWHFWPKMVGNKLLKNYEKAREKAHATASFYTRDSIARKT